MWTSSIRKSKRLFPKTNKDSPPDIVSLVEGYGVKLRQTGSLYRGLCPFHPDKRPSLVVYPANQSWFCFGCHKGGDAIQFVMEIEGCSFPEAKAKLGLNSEAATKGHISPRRRTNTLRTELRELEDTLERILVRSLKRLDKQLRKGEISLCDFYTKRIVAEDRLAEFDRLRTANHFYLRNWR